MNKNKFKQYFEEIIPNLLNYKRWENEINAFLSALIIGFIAHGYIFFNNITLHDNIYNFYMGGTYTSGRWMLAKLLRLSQVIYDTNYLHYSTPWYLGFISLIWIGMSAALIIFTLKIKSRALSILMGGILVSFPVITSLFGYMFTSGMYSFGTFMGVVGVFFVCSIDKVKSWKKLIPVTIGILLQACSVGVYQANIGVIASFTIIVFLKSLDYEEVCGIIPIIKRVLYFVLETLCYLITYYIASIYFVKRVGESLSSYQGIGNMGQVGITEYLSRIPVAYVEFFNPTLEQSRYMYSGGVKYFYLWVLIAIMTFIGINLFTQYRHKLFTGTIYAPAVLVFPLCANIIYVMCDGYIYSMMVYGEVMIFVLLLYLCSIMKLKWKSFANVCTVIPITIMVILYCRYANVCYLNADYVQKAGISYFNRMVTRIESTEGYVAGMPIVFIGERPSVDSSLFLYTEFDEIHIWPYEFKTMVNNWNWYDFMKSNCGFDPPRGDATLFADNEEVISMPSYPSDGSIQIIDGFVVIKLE